MSLLQQIFDTDKGREWTFIFRSARSTRSPFMNLNRISNVALLSLGTEDCVVKKGVLFHMSQQFFVKYGVFPCKINSYTTV